MLNAADIRDASFSKSVSGYKKDEVDQLLIQIEEDYKQFAKMKAEYENTIETLKQEKESFKASSDSIQAVLLNAQKLAEQIVAEAKSKSEEILQKAQTNIEVMTAQEKELASVFEMKANERKATLEKELAAMVLNAKNKAAVLQAAAEDSVRRQQLLYDKLQMEMSSFKATVTAKYREHLELLKDLPEASPVDPTKMAELAGNAYDKVPAPESFFSPEPQEQSIEDIRSGSVQKDEAAEETKAVDTEGFKVSV